MDAAGSDNVSRELVREFYLDPILAMRSLFPEWFPSKMPWIHRGLVALVLKKTDFLTKFGEELWQDGTDSWTRSDLECSCAMVYLFAEQRRRRQRTLAALRDSGIVLRAQS